MVRSPRKSIVEQTGLFTLNFDCKPQRFLKTGEYPTPVEEPMALLNPTAFTALPLITVYGTGEGTVTVGDITVRIKVMEDHLILDSDTQNAYTEADGVMTNQNYNIYAPVFPQLEPGVNQISWTGGVERLEIIPRWWTL